MRQSDAGPETLTVHELASRYGKKVYNIAYRITGNPHDAEDVTQETFMHVHRNIDRFRGESSEYTWLYRIAVNTSLQVRRTLNKTYIDSLDETIHTFENDIPDEVERWRDDPETEYMYNELLEEVQKGCYHFITFRLTDEQRVPYVLRAMLGFSLDDIASILEISKNTVKARLHRAKAGLKKYFSGRCQWVEDGGDCTCESRLGFALALAPEIIQRLRNHPPDKNIKEVMRSTLARVPNADEVYSKIGLEPYDTEALQRYLSDA